MSGGGGAKNLLWLSLIPISVVAILVCVPASRKFLTYSTLKSEEKIENKKNVDEASSSTSSPASTPYTLPRIKILYGSVTGTAKSMAYKLSKLLLQKQSNVSVTVMDVKDYDEDRFLDTEDVLLFLCCSWTDGKPPESAQRFLTYLEDLACDFRVNRDHLKSLRFAVFGLGGAIYGENFCKPTRQAHEYLVDLGASPLLLPMRGDDASDLESKYFAWSTTLSNILLSKSSSSSTPSSSSGLNNDNDNVNDRANTIGNKSKEKDKKIKRSSTDAAKNKPKRGNAFQEQQKLVKSESKKNTNSSSSSSSSSSSNSSGSGSSSSSSSNSNNGSKVDEKHKHDEATCCSSKDGGHATSCENKKETPSSSCCGNGNGNGDEAQEDEDEEEEDRINSRFITLDSLSDSDDDDDDGAPNEDDGKEDGILDMEDLGAAVNSSSNNGMAEEEISEGREMVTKLQRRALTKEGYRIIGSHSAVKLCRWTKNQMRGRGGCYKHTFYGITSYQCMEATPSLACANKCVFCWRHHKNPVGTEWRWKTDDPNHIVEEAVDLHRSMINEMRGVPGVLPERLVEAFTVKHCALSLVGEPIMYPRINEMLSALHSRKISSFLVTNAQFPDRIKQLDPVTQLYVSVDASTRDSLKAIDRPLFKDFWERYLQSLREMRDRRQRTVYRMTLVKSWNMEECEGYAELIELGRPDFIEIKAVTYCGKSDASSLTMQNVPWHKEVCAYSEALSTRLAERGIAPKYSIATEHAHSCCILLAREDKFKVEGKWHTWIDYERFHQLIQAYYASNGEATFDSSQYMERTPDWALYQSETQGFDPEEQRWRRTKAGNVVEIEYKSSESGCG